MQAGAGQSDFWDQAAVNFGKGIWSMLWISIFALGAGIVAAGIYGSAWTVLQIVSHVALLIRGQ